MDEENKQVTAEEVYSYGESTEEPAEKEEPEPETTGSEDSQDNKFVYQDNQYDYSLQTEEELIVYLIDGLLHFRRVFSFLVEEVLGLRGDEAQ